MLHKKGMKLILAVCCGAAICFAGSAFAHDAIRLFINDMPLRVDRGAEPQLVDGAVVAPVRALAEAMGGRVVWDGSSRSVHIDTAIHKEQVAEWIREQGEEKEPNAYYFDGLSVEQVNLDRDPELEIIAKIDGAVHLGNFFVFDQQADDTYRLIYEQPWHVDSWILEPIRVDGPVEVIPLYQIFTRTGGSGMDVQEAHLMYMSETGAWIEAWKGILKDRAIFQGNYHATMGGYRLNDDNGQLFYWQTQMDIDEESGQPTHDPVTTQKVFTMEQGYFIEQL